MTWVETTPQPTSQDGRHRGNQQSTKKVSASGKVDPAALTWWMKVWISGPGEQEAPRPEPVLLTLLENRSSGGGEGGGELQTTN